MHIDHVALWTRDLEALRAFYEQYFGAQAGAKYANPRTGFASYFLRFEGGARLEIMQMDGIPDSRDDPLAQHTGLIHLAIGVGSEAAVDALSERLRVDGVRVIGEPRRTVDGYYESVVLDPDGNRIEITV